MKALSHLALNIRPSTSQLGAWYGPAHLCVLHHLCSCGSSGSD